MSPYRLPHNACKCFIKFSMSKKEITIYIYVQARCTNSPTVHRVWGSARPQRSIVRSLPFHFCRRLFPKLEPMTSWSYGGNFTGYSKAPLRNNYIHVTWNSLMCKYVYMYFWFLCRTSSLALSFACSRVQLPWTKLIYYVTLKKEFKFYILRVTQTKEFGIPGRYDQQEQAASPQMSIFHIFQLSFPCWLYT